MKRFRIEKKHTYVGCIPTTVYVVQVRNSGNFFDNWVDVKGFDLYSRAEQLLNILNS